MSAYESSHWARAIATRFRSSFIEPASDARNAWRSAVSAPSMSVNASTVFAVRLRRNLMGRRGVMPAVCIGEIKRK